MYIVFILQCQKAPKQLQDCLKRAETCVVVTGFNGVLYHICAYTVIRSNRRSTWIGYQKNYILVRDRT